jgi:V8-like Glu-specific endopeptidase
VVVEFLSGARAGQRLSFDAPRTLRFGRHPDNDVAFDPQVDRDASGRHAELRMSHGGYRLFDLGSANGTIVAAQRLSPEGMAIEGPTEIAFGDAGPRCRVTVLSEAPGALDPITQREPIAPALGPEAFAPTGREQHFGAKTVAGMLDEALRRARARGRRQGLALAISVALAASVVGAAAAMLWRNRPTAMRKELIALVAAQATAGDAERAALQQRIDRLAQRLGGGVDVAKRNRDTVFLAVSRGGIPHGFCTAFAVAPKRLLTNAHCVDIVDELHRKGAKVDVVPNGGGPARAITAWKRARGFHASSNLIGTDVGWLEVETELPHRVAIAPPAALEALAAGDTMSTYGFPGRLNDLGAPEATYVTGVIGRVTTLDGKPGTPRERQLLQHSAFTSAGTSGSPLFDAEGRVIGINAGGYLDEGTASRPLPGYNYGLRIDLALTLLNEADE